jgi:hypothetical protein
MHITEEKEAVMIEFFQAGGFVMYFLLLFGVAALVAAGAFVHRPGRAREDLVKALGRVLLWTTLGGVASCLAAVCFKVPSSPQWAHSPDLPLIVMQGIGESMTPAILGFAFLTLVELITAVGYRRWAPQREG